MSTASAPSASSASPVATIDGVGVGVRIGNVFDVALSTLVMAMRPYHRPNHAATQVLFWCLVLITLPHCVPQCNGEYFSSVDQLQRLGDIELDLVETFRQYFDMQQKEFANYRKFIEHVKTQHSMAFKDMENYLGNPINAFTLIKRMVVDWNHLTESIGQSEARQSFKASIEKFMSEVKVPDDSELNGAVRGLARLQKVYNLNAYDLADGEINGIYYGSQLNWQECLEIATNLFEQKELVLAISWFEVTLSLLVDANKSDKDGIISKYEIDVLEYLALAHYDVGNVEKANFHIDMILDIDPDHPVKETKTYIERSVPRHVQTTDLVVQNNYTRLCRGETNADARIDPQLKCQLTTAGNPVFTLAPLKKEQLSFDPEVAVYYGLLNDAQIEQIVDLADDRMERSGVRKTDDGNTMVTDSRVSQTAWLHYVNSSTKSLKNLVHDITGFDLNNFEQVQVVNYGIGGSYEPHYDFFPTKVTNFDGDRISTSLFYLSDVEQGGYTVFPRLNVYVPPVKGSMLHWYNLHRSLDSDYRTLHAGCPVLKGSKRIGNVWVHSGLQEFARPCELKSDKYKSAGFEY